MFYDLAKLFLIGVQKLCLIHIMLLQNSKKLLLSNQKLYVTRPSWTTLLELMPNITIQRNTPQLNQVIFTWPLNEFPFFFNKNNVIFVNLKKIQLDFINLHTQKINLILYLESRKVCFRILKKKNQHVWRNYIEHASLKSINFI